ncbi:MAG: valine--tRNA ligase [Bacteroidetes bacterium]|jgi:valyl-tRNA synthetase|nr:valine--tRNA ligase [Bacteroidota bacterium]
MQLSDKYSPQSFESDIYESWLSNDLFKSTPNDKTPYTIVIPPPNVTGILHMGHMLNNTLQDVLIRRARMQGFNACWVPGTDHASIATEAKVVAMLKEQGIDKKDLTRESFLKHAFEWKEKYGGIILKQLQQLGCSCDWDRTRFTMEDDLYSSVVKVFVDLYNKDLIYKGVRMVNWDPVGKTALSDEEVIHREVDSRLFYVKYKIVGSDEFITVATTRPETILGDTAICVNPDDERYKHLKGKNAIVPIVSREVPIIFDEYVQVEFGTGALKVTPAHDINDYNLGLKYNLEVIDTINDDGTMSDAAGHYIGEDRFYVRKNIGKKLEELGNLVKIEPYKNKVGFSERTNAMIEPKLSQQWFVNMEAYTDRNPEILSKVMDDTINIHPSKLKNTYRHWIENLKDWCISRQLWWGQQIPAYYLPNGKFVVAETKEKALEEAVKIDSSVTLNDLKQDEDVLDTWFSSWLWPISVFNGINEPNNPEIEYYYPTNVLVTGPDIIFFWVARMIMAGYEYRDTKPFEDVYFTGIVRDEKGRKMSKQLGNSPDAVKLMEQYGTDGVRMGLMMAAPAGNDLLFDEALCEQGRNFGNKIWNAYRLIQGWETIDKSDDAFYQETSKTIHQWMSAKISDTVKQVDDHFSKFRVSDAMTAIYKLIWGDFCAWYLEWMKPAYGAPIPADDLKIVKEHFEQLLRLLHPFMPFLTEKLWQDLNDRKDAFINQSEWPETNNNSLDASVELSRDLVSLVRSVRNNKNISPKIAAQLSIKTNNEQAFKSLEIASAKLANIGHFQYGVEQNGLHELLGTHEINIAFEGVDLHKKDLKEIESEIKRLEGFLFGINKKLSNEKFVANAAEAVVDRERQKQADTQSKIDALKKEL